MTLPSPPEQRETPDRDPVTPPPSAARRLLAVVGPVVALLTATLGTAGLSWLLLGSSIGDEPPGVVVAYVVVQSAVVCAVVVGLAALLARVHGLRLADLGLRWTRDSAGRLLLGLGLGAGVLLLVGLPLTAAGLLRAGDEIGLPWWALVVAGLAQALVLQGFPEELLFRGYQMSALRLRPVPALVVSSGVFAVIHLLSSGGQQSALERVLYLAMPLGFAFAGGALMILTGSLWAAVGVHAGLHVGFLLGLPLGLGNGPALWVGCGALWVLAGVALLRAARRRGLLDRIWSGSGR